MKKVFTVVLLCMLAACAHTENNKKKQEDGPWRFFLHFGH